MNNNNNQYPRDIISSFRYSMWGLAYVIKTQKHMKFHFLAGILILLFSWFLHLSKIEFLILTFAIFFVLVTEMVNTAIEITVDIKTQRKNPLARISKDVAAGCVLLASLNAVIVGLVILGPKIFWIIVGLFGK